MVAVGVDACKKGWIAVVLRTGTEAQVHFLETHFSKNLARRSPMLKPSPSIFQSDCLQMVVVLLILRPRKSSGLWSNSAFFTPVRAALEARDHLTATRWSFELTGHGVSQQAFALRSKIFEVEQWLPDAPCPGLGSPSRGFVQIPDGRTSKRFEEELVRDGRTTECPI